MRPVWERGHVLVGAYRRTLKTECNEGRKWRGNPPKQPSLYLANININYIKMMEIISLDCLV